MRALAPEVLLSCPVQTFSAASLALVVGAPQLPAVVPTGLARELDDFGRPHRSRFQGRQLAPDFVE